MITRGRNFKDVGINVVGSSTFGRYPKISIEKTYNMFASDNWLVPYAGYQPALPSALGNNARGTHTSTNLNRLVCVVDDNVYLVNVFFDQNTRMTYDTDVIKINTFPLSSSQGVVYIAENNVPQIAISDGKHVYIYDPNPKNSTPTFYVATGGTSGMNVLPINFTPGFIDFHDNYFIVAASNNTNFAPAANNTWRLSSFNADGQIIFDETTTQAQAANTGLLQTKPDQVQAVVRFPSEGNMVIVMGKTVTEAWFDTAFNTQTPLFPYQRSTQFSIDYGCLNPATIAANDKMVVWLAQNEKSGPIIMFSTGGDPEKITTDGIDYLFSQLSHPEISEAFLYRQDGHLFYHINFYDPADNLSLFYDFNTKKFYHASDQNLNFFIAGEVAFFNNQYYFLANPKDTTGAQCTLYAFDTIFTTYTTQQTIETIQPDGQTITTYVNNVNEIPRIRTCANVRSPKQEYFVANDVGFTIETGETPYQQQDVGPILWITQDGQNVITQGATLFLITQDDEFIETQDGNVLISQQTDPSDINFLEFQQNQFIYTTPRVDLSISIDGGASFSSDFPYVLNGLAQRRNRLMWWQLGLANDMVCQFKFWGLGRFVATDGIMHIRQ